jgi:hypothetical protein
MSRGYQNGFRYGLRQGQLQSNQPHHYKRPSSSITSNLFLVV